MSRLYGVRRLNENYMITNLNDRWSRAAMRATEPIEPKQGTAAATAAVPRPEPAPVVVDPALVKKFIVKNVKDSEKSGPAATSLNGVRSQWMDVTPEMASRWLRNNFRNRPVKDDVVSAYARDMVNGAWQPTHQGIAFNDRDELIDGQHRLMAVVKSRCTVRMMVTFNLPAKIEGHEMTTMDCVDRGCTRSVADQLKIQHGLKSGGQIAQVTSTLAHLCIGERMRRMSVGQTLEIYREFKVEMDFIIANRSKMPGLKSAGVLGGFVFVLATQGASVNERPAAKMFNALVWGDDKKEGHRLMAYPALKALHVFLTGENASLILASMNRGIAELTVWALLNVKSNELAKEPANWMKAVEHCREPQAQRVKKMAGLFTLPK